MLARQKVMLRLSAFALLLSPCCVSSPAPQTKDTSNRAAVISWYADLNGSNESPVVSTEARAKAEFIFDFQTQTAKFQITPENLKDVSKVLLLTKGEQANLKGSAVLTLYDASRGPALSNAYTRTFTGDAFKEISNAVLNGMAVVEVTTKTHPNGEIVGPVEMHKSYK